MKSLRPVLIRELDVFAASGLWVQDSVVAVVSDDELSLAIYEGAHASRRLPLLPGKLPSGPKKRKKLKPDFEALVPFPEGFLALPSGSKKNRQRAVIITIPGEITREFSVTRTYEALEKTFSELNIEGGIVRDDLLILFQRGNGKRGENGLITMRLQDFLKDNAKFIQIQEIDLGAIHETKLGFTDACYLQGDLAMFLAVAEASDSTYLDGEVLGSYLGVLNLRSLRFEVVKLDMESKPEGLSFSNGEIYLCTDDDSRAKPSCLYFVGKAWASSFQFLLNSASV